MRGRVGITLTCICAWSFAACMTPALLAQRPSSPQQPAQAASQDSANDLFVTVGESVLVDTTKPIVRIAIGLGDIAEATPTSPNEVMVNGKTPGQTSLIVWQAGGGRQFFNVTVRPSAYVENDSMGTLRRELRKELPGQKLQVSAEGGLIFLRGTVKDINSSNRALQIASTAGKVVNLLYIDVPPAQPQILLKVRFASVDRTREQQLGLNIFSTGAANTIGTLTTGQFSPPTVSQPTGTAAATATVANALNLFLFRQDLNLGATLQALETK